MTSTFQNLPAEKQARILRAAGEEFALRGFENAKMSAIARAAGVSVGSLYKYFDHKQDMYLHVIRSSIAEMEQLLQILSHTDVDIIVKTERILREIQRSSRKNPLLMKLYAGTAAQNDPALAAWFAREIETSAARIYRQAIREAQQIGDIRPDIDADFIAFVLHSQFMMLQFSYACDYHTERLKIYAGEDIARRDDFVVEQMLKFLKNGLR
ncbi:MAG: TetR/AcrR family transcriptional regulator [Oscillospiraceae bacterium]|jgi:AcrR family transcriptional regulator|nr:TetR/AcrR family transcriptional regulator [Oscillospiraceae bacterium]